MYSDWVRIQLADYDEAITLPYYWLGSPRQPLNDGKDEEMCTVEDVLKRLVIDYDLSPRLRLVFKGR